MFYGLGSYMITISISSIIINIISIYNQCSVALRSRENAMKLKESIEIHCEGNPFTELTPLKDIALSALILGCKT